jgi:hypothetical protein
MPDVVGMWWRWRSGTRRHLCHRGAVRIDYALHRVEAAPSTDGYLAV